MGTIPAASQQPARAAQDQSDDREKVVAAHEGVERLSQRYRELCAGLDEMAKMKVERTLGRRVTDLRRLDSLLPRIGVVSVHGAQRARRTLSLLVPLELLQCGQQRPGLIALQAQMPDAPSAGRLELDERRRHIAVLGGSLAGCECRRVRAGQPRMQHVGNLIAALDGLDVPGERDEVAPETLVVEECGRGLAVA